MNLGWPFIGPAATNTHMAKVLHNTPLGQPPDPTIPN